MNRSEGVSAEFFMRNDARPRLSSRYSTVPSLNVTTSIDECTYSVWYRFCEHENPKLLLPQADLFPHLRTDSCNLNLRRFKSSYLEVVRPGKEYTMPTYTQTFDGALLLERATGLVLVSDTPKGRYKMTVNLSIQLPCERFWIDRLICSSGRGVFASTTILAGSLIEISPVLVLPLHDVNAINTTLLPHYT